MPGGATAEPGGPSVGRRRFRLRGGAVWGVAAGLFLLLEALLAIGAPLLTGTNPLTGNLEHRLLAPGTAGYLLGTDQLGRDVLARMLYGARISLVVGVVAVAVAGTVGVVVGLLIGYRRDGWTGSSRNWWTCSSAFRSWRWPSASRRCWGRA